MLAEIEAVGPGSARWRAPACVRPSAARGRVGLGPEDPASERWIGERRGRYWRFSASYLSCASCNAFRDAVRSRTISSRAAPRGRFRLFMRE